MEETYSKWPESQKVYVNIKILTPRGCLPLPRGYYMYKNMEKLCIKDFKDIFFETCNKWAKWQSYSQAGHDGRSSNYSSF